MDTDIKRLGQIDEEMGWHTLLALFDHHDGGPPQLDAIGELRLRQAAPLSGVPDAMTECAVEARLVGDHCGCILPQHCRCVGDSDMS